MIEVVINKAPGSDVLVLLMRSFESLFFIVIAYNNLFFFAISCCLLILFIVIVYIYHYLSLFTIISIPFISIYQ